MILTKIIFINYIFRLSNTILGLGIFYFLEFDRASLHVAMIYFVNAFTVLSRVGIDAQMQKSIASSEMIKQDLKNTYIGSTITSTFLSIIIYFIWSQIFIESGSALLELPNFYYIALLINVHLTQSIMIYTFTNTRFFLFLGVASLKTFILFIAAVSEIFNFNLNILNYQIFAALLLLFLISKNFSFKDYAKRCLLKANHFVTIFNLYITSLRYFLIINSGSVFWIIFSSALASISIENLGVFRIIGFLQGGIGILGVILNSIKLGLRGSDPDPKKFLDNFFLILCLGSIIGITIFDNLFINDLNGDYKEFASIAFMSIACICVATLLHSYLNEHLAYVNSSNLLLLIPVAFITTAGVLSLLSAKIYVGYLLEFLLLASFYLLLSLILKKNTNFLEISFFLIIAAKVTSDVW